MLETKEKHVWLAQEYHNHSSAQFDAAMQVIEHLQLVGCESVLDIGCGDGKISALFARNLPDGSVIGVDVSPEMVDFASRSYPKESYPNLSFLLLDAQNLNFSEMFDVIFSSFALQWLPKPGLFFKSAYEALKTTGILAATIPLDVSLALEESIRRITALPQWRPFFHNFCPKWHFISESQYKEYLLENQFSVSRFVKASQNVVFPSRECFEKYVIQWFSYLRPLPKVFQDDFFKQIIDEYLRICPSRENGEVNFTFSRLDVIASKAIL